ncbi:hypothetical protein Rrhod_3719 [Rhodococcus rhodnii LMG 5362]|uniref:Uncharacterized protein n=2 Tax=Rhodococcus rhodnii TaxID=38312 RepID=R7WLS7_9NOCA|nr:hypothetical protein Rrhod_3719 [Rhodococcus rhodnii LMG 5362]
MIDSALHYRIEVDPDDWDSVAINAFLALAVPEVFAYQRPLFDQMALLVDASRPTPSLSSFRRAAKSAREQHDSSVSEQP